MFTQKQRIIFVPILSFLATSLSAANPDWINYTSNEVYAIVESGDFVWAGGCGLVKVNKNSGDLTYFNRANSGLPNNYVHSMAVDKQGVLWIGTYGSGLARFDGGAWTTYDGKTSPLPSDYVNCVVIDGNNIKWIGTSEGLTRFDGSTSYSIAYRRSCRRFPRSEDQNVLCRRLA